MKSVRQSDKIISQKKFTNDGFPRPLSSQGQTTPHPLPCYIVINPAEPPAPIQYVIYEHPLTVKKDSVSWFLFKETFLDFHE